MDESAIRKAALLGAIAVAAIYAFAPLGKSDTLNQGWDRTTQHRYYYESQGTRFIPAALLEALRTPTGTRFMDPANMRGMGFIVESHERSDAQNPYGWPIGFAIDRDKSTGIAMAGFTCAACHTSQIAYRGSSLLVEGGAANVDINAFRKALAQAVIFTGTDTARRAKFENEAVALGFPRTHVSATFDQMLATMEHGAKAPPEYVVASTPAGPGRLDALNAIATALFATNLDVPANAKKGDAPVNFPYLWDIWRFDWVQYNASVRQPMERNIGEALGVGVQTHFVNPATGTVNPEPLRWKSSARVQSLYWMENALSTLRPPQWPEAILGRIDRSKAQRGRALFMQNCSACHGIQRIAGTNPVEWHVPVIALDKIGTDPNQAADYAKHTFDATKLGLSAHVRTPVGLGYVVERVKKQAYVDAGIPKTEWPKYDGFGRTSESFPAPCGYKARPLIGVWATGPFLHNGSVPTIYDLLSQTRPAMFWFGSTEFDPHKIGFIQTQVPGAMQFASATSGNSTAGHWFTNDRSRRGRIGRALSDAEKYAIIEYLKAATPADYPERTVRKPGAMPCETNPAWADRT